MKYTIYPNIVYPYLQSVILCKYGGLVGVHEMNVAQARSEAEWPKKALRS